MSGPSRDDRGAEPALGDLLVRERPALIAWLRRHARGLLRYETEEDLAQGVHLRALAACFAYRGQAEFMAWLLAVARQHVANRHEHWAAKKRAAADFLRATARLSTAGGPVAATRGPATRAERREALVLAARAVALLLPRDRELVRAFMQGVDLGELADRLGMRREAVERARLRALDRFRRTFELLSRSRTRAG